MMGISLAECENDVLRRKHKEIKRVVAGFRKQAKEYEQMASEMNGTTIYTFELLGKAEAFKKASEELEQILNK